MLVHAALSFVLFVDILYSLKFLCAIVLHSFYLWASFIFYICVSQFAHWGLFIKNVWHGGVWFVTDIIKTPSTFTTYHQVKQHTSMWSTLLSWSWLNIMQLVIYKYLWHLDFDSGWLHFLCHGLSYSLNDLTLKHLISEMLSFALLHFIPDPKKLD